MSKILSERIKIISPGVRYDMPDEYYDAANSGHFWIEWRFRMLCSILPKNFDWGQTLDVGCGNGITVKQIEEYYGNVISGCEANLSLLSRVVTGSGQLYYYDITERQNEFKELFSNIILFDVLEHIKDPVVFLDAVRFHLKNNGRLIINVPAFSLFYSFYDEAQGHFRRYTMSGLIKELAATGFRIEKASYWGMSLAPLLLMRKYIMRLCRRDSAMKIGFYPSSPYINTALKIIGMIETSLFSHPLFGTSLMAIVRKEG